MPFNGNGTFNRIYNWVNDKNNGIPITASRMDGDSDGFATGLSTCITKDGQQTATARIPFALGIGVFAGTSSSPSINFTGNTNTGIYQSASGSVDISSAGARVGGFNVNGLDNTVIGAGTPKAGTFTTITAATQNVSGLTASSAVATDASKNLVSVTNTGTGNNVLATSPTLTTPTLGVASATSINFGGTALANYVQGTWTPADNSGAGLSFTGVSGSYTRIGNVVIASCNFNYPSTASGANASISGLPLSGGGSGKIGGTVVYTTASTLRYVLMNGGGGAGTTANLYNSSGAAITNSALSTTVVYLQFIYLI